MATKPSVLRFKFGDFVILPSERDESVTSERKIDCHGNGWELELYPGGREWIIQEGEVDENDNDDPYVGVFLRSVGTSDVFAKYIFILRDSSGKEYVHFETEGVCRFDANGIEWGFHDFIKRSEVLDENNDILVNGALLLDAIIHIKPEPKSLHVPANPFLTNMSNLLENADDADVTFMVESTIIAAHKLILKMNAPLLHDFCEGCKKGSKVQIRNRTPKIFRMVLRYVYGGNVPDSVSDDVSKDLIIAADQFGVPGLKLAVETILVEGMILDRDNIADWLLFADSKTCSLLKEYAMSYCAVQAGDLAGSKWLEKLEESPKLMAELMKEMSSQLTNDSRFDTSEGMMSVNELRKKLGEMGLDVDGSKEMLVSRLKESNKRQRTG